MTESFWKAADHVSAFFRVHVLCESGIGVGVFNPVRIAQACIFEGDVWEGFNKRGVEAAEVGELMRDDVLDLVLVFGREGHAEVAEVGYPGNGAVEFLLCEGGWKKEQGGTDGGEEIDLVGETDTWIVTEDLDGFLEAAGDI